MNELNQHGRCARCNGTGVEKRSPYRDRYCACGMGQALVRQALGDQRRKTGKRPIEATLEQIDGGYECRSTT